MNRRYAVILSGCGAKDGSEIHEAVMALYAIKENGNDYAVFAPDIEQKEVVNHLNDKVTTEKRNVLVESARIARGSIRPLGELAVDQFDVLLFPGGFGAAKNLFDFAFKYTDFTVLPAVEQVARAFYAAGKPIGAMCIAPVMMAKIFSAEKAEITLGAKGDLANDIEAKFGVTVVEADYEEAVVDAANRIVTTPAYMYGDATIVNIARGALNMVRELDRL